MINNFTLLITSLSDSAANQLAPEKTAGSDIYVVLFVTLIVWLGIFSYLFYLDRKVKKVKEKVEMHAGQ